MAEIRPMQAGDLPDAARIIKLAFGTFLGVPDLENFWSDRDYAYGRFGAEHIAAFAAERDGELAGSNFAIRWGSVGVFGPLTTRPDLWDSGIGQGLVAAASDQFEAWGVRHAGLFTFPHSTKHVWTYGKFGFHPRFLTAVMSAPAATSGASLSRYSGLPEAQRAEVDRLAAELTDALYPGLDLGGEMRTVHAKDLGDTLLLWDGDSRLAGFACCHWGPASEAGAGTCLVKFAAVWPGDGAEARFAALLDGCRSLAAAAGIANVMAGVNLGRAEAYRLMQARGFRTAIQGVTMHRPNESGYSRPELYVLDDWR